MYVVVKMKPFTLATKLVSIGKNIYITGTLYIFELLIKY